MNTSNNAVTAKIVDQNGAPVAGQPVYLCGINVCSPASMTKSDGTATIASTMSLQKAAFKVGDALNYAELAIPLAMGTTDFTMGGTAVINTGKLSDMPGAALTPGQDATSGDVTLSIPGDASVCFYVTYDTPDSQLFRAVSIPLANEVPWLASAGVTGFQLLYGVTPSETPICPPAKVTVALPSPNTTGWSPGDAVEFWITTADTGQQYAPYAGWAKMSDGAVSADGKTVSTADGQGFIVLENFAIRKKQ
jgi:hypothetical protein